MSYIVGVGNQNAVNTRSHADHWESQDPIEHRFLRRVTGQLRVHDDRVELLAGIDIILTGLVAAR